MSEGEVRDQQLSEQPEPTSDTGKALAALFVEDEQKANAEPETEAADTTPQETEETTEPVEEPATTEAEAAPEVPTEETFYIGGEQMTRAQVEELVGKGKNADNFIKSATQKAQEAAAKERELAAQKSHFDELEARELTRQLDTLPPPPPIPVAPIQPDVDDYEDAEQYQAARKQYKADYAEYQKAAVEHPRLLAEWQQQRAEKTAEIKTQLAQLRQDATVRARTEQEELDAWVQSEAKTNGLTQQELDEAWAVAIARKAEREAKGFHPHVLDLLSPAVEKVYAKRAAKIAATETAALANQKKVQEANAVRAPAGKPASAVAAVPKPKSLIDASDDEIRDMLKKPGGMAGVLKSLFTGG